MVFSIFSKTPWLWFSSSWPKPQSYDLLHGFNKAPKIAVFFFLVFFPKLHGYDLLLLHGFFQSSQNHLLLPSRTFKFMVFLFLDFSKAPKVPKAMLLLFLIIFQDSMAMLFFFLVETSKSCYSFSWPYLQSHGLLLLDFA
jgi:hypothetical protein